MLDDSVFFQLIGTVDQVLPHKILGERKYAENHILSHFEAGRILDRVTNVIPNALYVDPALVCGQVAIQPTNRKAKVSLQ